MTAPGATLEQAARLTQEGKYQEAWRVVQDLLQAEPANGDALMLATLLADKDDQRYLSYLFAKEATRFLPESVDAWMNWGHTAEELYLFEEAVDAFRTAIKVAPTGKEQARVLAALSAMYVDAGMYEQTEKVAREALRLDPEAKFARSNLGMALLALGQWEEGWRLYRYGIGSESKSRRRTVYGDEPEWDGTPGLTVALSGTQGLGDEVSFASMVPDAVRACKRVILDVDARLEGLFRRSFPQATVHGTRWAKTLDWPEQDRQIDASLTLDQLGEYYRPTPESCPGTPYLVPCPVRRQQWLDLFATLDKPVIGVAWTGGVHHTGAKYRHWRLDDLLPIFRAVDAHWVCLQYKDAAREIEAFRQAHGIEVHQYPWATLTKDYDDCAALVSSLDMVISMQTSVVHLAGALGVPTWVFVQRHNQWRYGVSGESIPWYSSVRVLRNRDEPASWQGLIDKAARELPTMGVFDETTAGIRRVRSEGKRRHQRAHAQHPAPRQRAGVGDVGGAASVAGGA